MIKKWIAVLLLMGILFPGTLVEAKRGNPPLQKVAELEVCESYYAYEGEDVWPEYQILVNVCRRQRTTEIFVLGYDAKIEVSTDSGQVFAVEAPLGSGWFEEALPIPLGESFTFRVEAWNTDPNAIGSKRYEINGRSIQYRVALPFVVVGVNR